MIVVCEKCSSRFKLDESRIKASRFKARCSRCRHVFTAVKPTASGTGPSTMTVPTAVARQQTGTVIAVSNQKGGVAKTTTCLHLGLALTQMGKRVLLIDFDVQANLTLSLGYRRMASFYDLLDSPKETPDSALVRTRYQNLSLLPSNKNMVLLNKRYFGAPRYEYILRDRLARWKDRFDFIVIDTPPSIEFFTLNALTASDLVIIPSQCDFLSTHGVDQILQLIELVRRKTNPTIDTRVLVTMYDEQVTASQVIFSKLRQLYGDRRFQTVIHYDDKLREAQIMNMPVNHYDEESRAAQEYMGLAAEMLRWSSGNGRPHEG